MALDANGNASDRVTVELINKAKEYEIQIDRDLFGNEKGMFRFPKDVQGLISAIKSLLQHGIERGFVDKKKADEFKALANTLLGKTSD